jgi:hypothetical protein
MFLLVVGLTLLTYAVMIQAEKHRRKLFETYEFSVIISKLPEVNLEYTLDHLEIDLWEHITKINKEEK